ncbi:MAG: DUF4214 domain-containing protein [Rhodobacteraceae bacterium]|nr:DUF4214 domain-containing protein [Paracoccaceae bacterium]
MRYSLPDGRVAFYSDTSFALTGADGAVLIDSTTIEATGSPGRISIMGLKATETGGLRVYFHEDLFQRNEDGTIFYQDYDAAGAPVGAWVTVSEQFHTFPQVRASLLTLENGTMLYAADILHAPDPANNFVGALYPTSFLNQIYPYASALAPTADGFVWATVANADSEAAARLHFFDNATNRIAVDVAIGSALHRPISSGFAARLHAVDVAQLENGSVVVAWASDLFPNGRFEAGTQSQGIYMAIRGADGTMVLQEAAAEAGTGLQVQETPRVFALNGGNFALVFQNRPDGNSSLNSDLYVRTYSPTGQQISEQIYSRGQNSPLQYVDAVDIEITPAGVVQYFDNNANGVLSPLALDGVAPPEVVRVEGTAGNDILAGTTTSETIEAGEGDDTVSGGGGNDTINGGAGNDAIFGDRFDVGDFADISAQVYRLYQATLDRAPDTTGHADWVQKLASGALNLAEVALGFVASAEFTQTYSTLNTAQFIGQIYQNVLGREVDATGLSGWSAVLENGGTRQDVVLGLSESTEFKNASALSALNFTEARSETVWADDLFRLYQATLDRAPDLAGLLGWSGQLGNQASFLDIVSGFVGSIEFSNTYGLTTDRDFVGLLYRNVLGRDADEAGFDFWTGQLTGNTQNRAEVVRGFSQSTEFVNATSAALKTWMRDLGIDDTINSGSGNNVVTGGSLADRFVFTRGDEGTTRVANLESWDQLNFQNFYQVAADALQQFRQVGTDVVLEDYGMRVILEDIQLSDITADMLI